MKVGKAQKLVIASRERETVAGYQTDNRSGGDLIALLCLTERRMGSNQWRVLLSAFETGAAKGMG
jgi:hypothetical protein